MDARLSTSRQKAHTSPVVGRAARRTGLRARPARRPTAGRTAARPARGTRSRRPPWRPGDVGLDGVEGVLVAEVLVAGRHRALLDLVVDAPEHAVGRRLPLAEAHQRLDLAGEAVARGQHRQLAGEVLGVPPQHVAEQHGGFVVEVVAGGDARRSRPRRAAWSNRWRFDMPHAEHGTRSVAARRGGDVEAVGRPGGRPRRRRSPPRRGEGAGVRARLVGVVADAEAEVEPVGVVAQVEEQVPQRQAVLAAATPPPAPARPAASSRSRRSPWSTWSRQRRRKCSAQKLALWRRQVDDGRAAAHPALHAAPAGDHRPDLDRVGVVEQRRRPAPGCRRG